MKKLNRFLSILVCSILLVSPITSLQSKAGDIPIDPKLDTDRDGIPDILEIKGYYVEVANGVVSIQSWGPEVDETKYTKYVTSPSKYSTDDDPYSDYEEVTGIGMDERVARDAQHPLVAAYPDINVNVENFTISNATTETSSEGYGKSVNVGTTKSFSHTDANTWGVGVTATANVNFFEGPSFGVSVSANYSNTTTDTESFQNSSSSGSNENWSTQISQNNADAANLTVDVRYYNAGTAPIHNVNPTTTFSINNLPVVSVDAREPQQADEILPGTHYPHSGTAPIAFSSKDDFGSTPIALNKQQLNELQASGSFQIGVPQVKGNIAKFDRYGRVTYKEEWTSYISLIEQNTAEIILDIEGVGPVKRNIAAINDSIPLEHTKPEITLKEAVKIGFGAVERNGVLYYKNIPLKSTDFLLSMDQSTLEYFKHQKEKNGITFWQVNLRAGMRIRIEAIKNYPNSEIGIYFFDDNDLFNVGISRRRYTLPITNNFFLTSHAIYGPASQFRLAYLASIIKPRLLNKDVTKIVLETDPPLHYEEQVRLATLPRQHILLEKTKVGVKSYYRASSAINNFAFTNTHVQVIGNDDSKEIKDVKLKYIYLLSPATQKSHLIDIWPNKTYFLVFTPNYKPGYLEKGINFYELQKSSSTRPLQPIELNVEDKAFNKMIGYSFVASGDASKLVVPVDIKVHMFEITATTDFNFN